MTNNLLWINKEQIQKHLSYEQMIRVLRQGFAELAEVPLRHHHTLGQSSDEFLLMPAWNKKIIAVKLITVYPENPALGLDAIGGVIVLFDREHGQPLAMMDAGAITVIRTAAASALASSYLSRADSTSLLMVGAGALASHLIKAHLSVRNINHVHVWARDQNKTEKFVAQLSASMPHGVSLSVVDNLQKVVAESDIISMATRATKPLIMGEWLSSGTHLDLVGSYRKDMREVDNDAVCGAALFADTKAGVLAEAGDIIIPINDKVINENHIQAELSELCAGLHGGREQVGQTTMFKSVGTALEDLLAAKTIYEIIRSESKL